MTYGATPKAVSKRKGRMVVNDSSPATSCHKACNNGGKIVGANPRCLAIFRKDANGRLSAMTCRPDHGVVSSST